MDNYNETNQDEGECDQFTIPSLPPEAPRRQRRSKWVSLFGECRSQPGLWRRTVEPFKPATAAQIASDIRNAWRRDPKKLRLRGLLEGERWEAVWGPSPDALDPEQCYIWLRYIRTGPDSENAPSLTVAALAPKHEIEYAW